MKFSAFVDARRRVRDLRLKSKKEWIQYCRSDKKPKDIPANPVAVYNSQWHDWGDWLSTGTVAHQNRKYMTFGQAKKYVHKLQLQNRDEWNEFARSSKRHESIPSRPD